MLAELVTRARLLRLEIVAVIDLGDESRNLARSHAQSIGIPLVARHSPQLDHLKNIDDLSLVIMASDSPKVMAEIRAGLPATLPVLGPESRHMIDGLVRLVDANRALRADSRRLKETRLRFKQFTETAPMAIYIKDTSLRYLKINAHAMNMLGVTESQILGASDEAIFGDSDIDWLQHQEREALRCRETLYATGVLPIRGHDIYVKVTIFPIIENGLVEGIYGLIEDTTELVESEKQRHRVDEQLSETQTYLREVTENSRDIIFMIDPAGRILSFNSGAEAALGFNRDEVIGTDAHRLCVIPGTFEKIIQETLRDGHTMTFETKFKTCQNETIVVNISLTLIEGADNKPLELVCICRDITTRLRLKQDLIRSERLAAVGQLASGVAHEINNPLAVIDTIAGLVEETLQEEGGCLPPETTHLLNRAMSRLHSQVKRVTGITHSLLGFVRRPDTGMKSIDIVELLEGCLDVLGTEIRLTRTEVHRIFANDLPPCVSDPSLLEQVFVNLIKNAIDAITEAPGRPGRLEILVTRHDDHLRITFQDNGIGIPKTDQERIFNLFHTTKPAGKGTGLGLSIVHDILHRLGGSVRVDSEPGQWTRFIVEVPLKPPPALLPDPSVSI